MARGALYYRHEVNAVLAGQCEQAGGIRAWARENGLSPGHVSRVLSGEKEPGDKLLAPLGFEAETIYRAVRRK